MVRILLLIAIWALAAKPVSADPTPEPGWPVATGYSVSQSGVAVQLDADAPLEVAIASQDGYLYVFNHDGTSVPGFPQYMGSALGPDPWVNQCSSPAAADLDGDQIPEIIVGCFDGKLYAFRADGALVAGFPYTTGWMIFSTPAVGDIDGDERPEIVVGSNDGGIHAVNEDGSLCPGFPVSTPYVVRSSPALGDLDADGYPEIVITADNDTHHLYALDGDGAHLPGFPLAFAIGANSSPSLADLDQDGDLEIAVGSRDGFLHVLHHDGTYLPGWPLDAGYSLQSSPTLADLDGDGYREIIIGLNDSKVSIYRLDGTNFPGWPQSTAYTVVTSASVADIDGIEGLEIIQADNTGLVNAWHSDGTVVPGFPLTDPTYTVYSSALLADLDGDDRLELLLGCMDTWIYCWDLGPGSFRPERMPWPEWRLDAKKTAAVPATPSSAVAESALGLELHASNPNRGRVVIRYRAPNLPPKRLDVYDLSGRRVRAWTDDDLDGWAGRLVWSGRTTEGTPISEGCYWFCLTCGTREATERVIVLH